VKAAALIAGLAAPERLFPDHFVAPTVEEQEAAAEARGDTVVHDYSDVQFEMPSDETSAEETLRLVQAMGANLDLSVDGDIEESTWTPQALPGDGPAMDAEEWL